jgi:hypothetical protein
MHPKPLLEAIHELGTIQSEHHADKSMRVLWIIGSLFCLTMIGFMIRAIVRLRSYESPVGYWVMIGFCLLLVFFFLHSVFKGTQSALWVLERGFVYQNKNDWNALEWTKVKHIEHHIKTQYGKPLFHSFKIQTQDGRAFSFGPELEGMERFAAITERVFKK